MKTQFKLILIFCIVSILICPAFGNAQQTIKVGLLHSFTSPLAVIGKQQINGIHMATDEWNAKGGINGKKIELVEEDSSNSNTKALAGLNKILISKPCAIFGPIWATQLFALFPTIEKEKIPTLTTSSTRHLTQKGNIWYFRLYPHDEYTKTAYTEFAVLELKKKKIAIIYTNNEYGHSGKRYIESTLKRYNLKPIASVSLNEEDKDVSSQLLTIKNSGADVIISQCHMVSALILKTQRELGINIPHVACSIVSTPMLVNMLTAEEIDGVYVECAGLPNDEKDPEIQAWVKKYDAIYKHNDNFALLTYDTANVLYATIKAVGPNPNAIREYLETHKFKGLNTTYAADKEHNMNHRAVIIQFKGKTPHIVRSFDYAPK